MKEGYLSILVSNHFGVLTRVTNLFGRRGFNISALTVGETETARLSRITIVTEGDEPMLEQVQKQLSKLEDVKKAKILNPPDFVSRELLLVKVQVRPEQRLRLGELLIDFGAKIAAEQPDCVVIELSGSSGAVNRFIGEMHQFGILEMCRTGPTAMELGKTTIYDG